MKQKKQNFSLNFKIKGQGSRENALDIGLRELILTHTSIAISNKT